MAADRPGVGIRRGTPALDPKEGVACPQGPEERRGDVECGVGRKKRGKRTHEFLE